MREFVLSIARNMFIFRNAYDVEDDDDDNYSHLMQRHSG